MNENPSKEGHKKSGIVQGPIAHSVECCVWGDLAFGLSVLCVAIWPLGLSLLCGGDLAIWPKDGDDHEVHRCTHRPDQDHHCCRLDTTLRQCMSIAENSSLDDDRWLPQQLCPRDET